MTFPLSSEELEDDMEDCPLPAPRADDYCHRCGHIHFGFKECGVDMGNGRVCRCEMEGAA